MSQTKLQRLATEGGKKYTPFPFWDMYGVWVGVLKQSHDSFRRVTMYQWTLAYDAHLASKGIKVEHPLEQTEYDKYLDMKRELEPIIDRNRAKLDKVRKQNGNRSRISR